MMGGTRPFEIVLGAVVLLIMALGWYARRHPEIGWLRAFDLRGRLTEDQQRRLQRTANVTSGAQLILLGVALPLGYFFLTMMMFSEMTRGGIAVVATASLFCIVAGVVGVARTMSQ